MNKIVEVAISQLGYSENPPNSNLTKYGEWFGLNGVPWCAIFVSWVYHQAGYPLGNIGSPKGMAGCQYAVDYFIKSRSLVTEPIPGDLVFFDWNDDGRYDHVGIFEGWGDSDSFITIEGNTSMKNDSNGGSVMRRIRYSIVKYIFVRPPVLNISQPSLF